jgi:GT2 family glycosyltransferase
MIFKKSILEELGGFDVSLGVTPTRRAYGEETDLLIRIHNSGHEIWYDPDIKVQHEYSTAKQSFWFVLKDQFIHGYNSRNTFKHLVKSNPSKTANTAMKRFAKPGLLLKTRLYFLLSPFAYLLGMLVGKINSRLG